MTGLILVFAVSLLLLIAPAPAAMVIKNGSLSVDTIPAGASIYIDGTLKGTTPFFSSSIAAGNHVLVFRLKGYNDLAVTVTVPSGGRVTGTYTLDSSVQTRVPTRIVTRQVSSGTLVIESVPSGASVYIDGALKGTTPFTAKAIAAGDHRVMLTMDGYADLTSTVTVPSGGESSNRYEMSCNVLSVDSVPSGASLFLNGEMKGTTPVTIRALRAGDYNIILKRSGYKDYITTETIPPGVQVNLHAMMVALQSGSISTTVPKKTVAPVRTTKTPDVCTAHFAGSGELSTDDTGRVNCTTILQADDRLSVATILQGTAIAGLGSKAASVQVSPLGSLEGLPDTGSGYTWTGRACTYLPEKLSFTPWISVSFPISNDELAGYDPQNLTIRQITNDRQGWEDLPTRFDPMAKTLSASVGRFGTIGIFSKESSPAPLTTPFATTSNTAEMANPSTRSSSLMVTEKMMSLAAVVAGITVTLLGTMAGVQAIFSRLWERIIDLIRNLLGDQMSGRINESEIERRALRPAENLVSLFFGMSIREILAICVAAIGFGVAFVIQDRLEVDLLTIAIFVCAGGIATLIPDLASKFFAYRSGCVTEYRVWPLGFLTMLATAWLFQNTFSKPSRALIMGQKDPSVSGRAVIKLAGPLTNIIIAVAFLCFVPLGGLFAVAGTAGFSINLLNGVFSLLPIAPNDGVEIFSWNKLVWAALFFPLSAFYLYVFIFL